MEEKTFTAFFTLTRALAIFSRPRLLSLPLSFLKFERERTKAFSFLEYSLLATLSRTSKGKEKTLSSYSERIDIMYGLMREEAFSTSAMAIMKALTSFLFPRRRERKGEVRMTERSFFALSMSEKLSTLIPSFSSIFSPTIFQSWA